LQYLVTATDSDLISVTHVGPHLEQFLHYLNTAFLASDVQRRPLTLFTQRKHTLWPLLTAAATDSLRGGSDNHTSLMCDMTAKTDATETHNC